MSRIRLEWDVESQQISNADSEDPQIKRARRRRSLLLLLIGLLLGAIAAAALLLRQRVIDVDNEIEALLHDTVRAEVAALRIGDLAAYLRIQRSASGEWIQQQQAVYEQYSRLKASQDLVLTANILDSAIDGQRGRVLVEEIRQGTAYAQVWFYWRYADGWHHVPPDYTFWGDQQHIESPALRVQYRSIDERFAQQLQAEFSAWLASGCAVLNCAALPQLQIEITPAAAQPAAWLDASRLQVQSPYVQIAHSTQPFDSARQAALAQLLAEGLLAAHTGGLTVRFPHDAVHLWQSTAAWLSARFVGAENSSPVQALVQSLAAGYGDDAVSRLVDLFTPTADMSILQQAVPLPIVQANLDWRAFIAWRLNTEAQLIASRAESDFLALYDSADPAVRDLAAARYDAGAPSAPQQVIAQHLPSGTAQLEAAVITSASAAEQTVRFNLVDGVWKRAS